MAVAGRTVGSPVGPLDALVTAFHGLHEREYNFRRDGAPVDLYRLNLRAVGLVPKAALAEHPEGGVMPAPHDRRPVWFGRPEPFDTPVYTRSELPSGVSFSGPAIVEQLDSTTVIPPGAVAHVDRYLNIVMRLEN